MADAKELINALRDDFFRRCENDRELKRITEKLENGTYVDAHDYSVRIGELLSQSFSEMLTEDIYPELTEEMAREIIPSLLGSGHRRTSDACVQVQRNLNQQAGLGLKPIEPEFDVSRAYDLAEKYISYDEWQDARWSLGEPVENFMQSVPDDSIRRNADFQWRSGMSPKIIRRAEPGACKWCRGLAGTYDYADVRETGNDVYRRHERCRCVVEYDPGDGKRQDVHSKKWVDNEERNLRIDKLSSDESELGDFRKLIAGEISDAEYRSGVSKKFSHGRKDAKRAFMKYVPKDSVADSNYLDVPHYQNGKIYMNFAADIGNPRGAFATWFHEHGHLIDEYSGNSSLKIDGFLEMLYTDLGNNLHKYSYEELSLQLQDVRLHSAVADLLNGLSNREIQGCTFHKDYEDGTPYWTDKSFCKEAFAHMFECQFDHERHEVMKQYFPRSLELFENYLRSI